MYGGKSRVPKYPKYLGFFFFNQLLSFCLRKRSNFCFWKELEMPTFQCYWQVIFIVQICISKSNVCGRTPYMICIYDLSKATHPRHSRPPGTESHCSTPRCQGGCPSSHRESLFHSSQPSILYMCYVHFCLQTLAQLFPHWKFPPQSSLPVKALHFSSKPLKTKPKFYNIISNTNILSFTLEVPSRYRKKNVWY